MFRLNVPSLTSYPVGSRGSAGLRGGHFAEDLSDAAGSRISRSRYRPRLPCRRVNGENSDWSLANSPIATRILAVPLRRIQSKRPHSPGRDAAALRARQHAREL